MKHAVIYVTGLGDTNKRNRQLLIASWWLYGVKPIVFQSNWSDRQPLASKLSALLELIDGYLGTGYRVSLVGESAGASLAVVAYAARQESIHRVVCLCGKLQNAPTISSGTYSRNPAFAESMAALPGCLASLSTERRQRIRSIHPLADTIVPIGDTIIPGAQEYTIPTRGHATSIILGCIVFNYAIIGFLKRR